MAPPTKRGGREDFCYLESGSLFMLACAGACVRVRPSESLCCFRNLSRDVEADSYATLMDAALDSAVRTAHTNGDDTLIAATLLSVSNGLDTSLARSDWNMEAILSTVGLLGRLQEGAPMRLVLGSFFGYQPWRDRYCDMAKRLHDLLPRYSPREQRSLAVAWVRLALQAVDEQMCDKATMQRVELPINELQQSVGDLVKRAQRSIFDGESRKALLGMLSRLSEAHREQQSGRRSALGFLGGDAGDGPGGGADTAGAGAPWTTAQLAPHEADLDPRSCIDPRENLVKGPYSSASAYLETHFNLLREDFVRPLRQALQGLHEGGELPRECRMWQHAVLAGTTVGQPGGILWRLRLASDASEADELDVTGGKALINGSLLLITDDHFRTFRCGVVARREAARQLGDGSVFVSLSKQSEAAMKSSKVNA